MPRAGAIRFIVNNHIVHHRGQLTVYLRLLDIAVPGLYGPSADEAMSS
ncbi:DinB family protein [Sphingobacterium siyangense]